MKSFLTIALGIISVVLVVALFMTKQSDGAQHDTDTAAIADLSNQLSSAQTQLAINSGTLVNLSNNLATCQSGTVTLSNQLADAQSAQANEAEQITNLSAKVAAVETDNQALQQRAAELTNQVTIVTQQLTTATNALVTAGQTLNQANTDYILLENRFRKNVAERVVMQRKFNNPEELQQQLARLKEVPSGEITADQIYAGLDVEVRSNGQFHVITPN